MEPQSATIHPPPYSFIDHRELHYLEAGPGTADYREDDIQPTRTLTGAPPPTTSEPRPPTLPETQDLPSIYYRPSSTRSICSASSYSTLFNSTSDTALYLPSSPLSATPSHFFQLGLTFIIPFYSDIAITLS